ncbi:hypothetical protein I3F58_02960 [Streptomyces sp. MUM 203J]|uniref:hypothetical protein n=1 Tax=Streptomyces sp. MUM 203J TaxID=2791990 RepID=UPI001F04A554|nr:hypothetical protein [Streptomyces sp. MUM 203J]MCH0538535.1 hypothetical protein [Streptomyces sp. MUM 203J]
MTTGQEPAQWRVDFDARVEFANGGSLSTEGFRLDIPGDHIDDAELGELLVRHLGLLMAGSTSVTRKELIREPHKGSRNTGTGGSGPCTVDLTGPATRAAWPGAAPPALSALVGLPVALVRLLGSAEPVADRLALAPFDLSGHAVVVHTGRPGSGCLTEDAVALLADRGAALLATDGTRSSGPAAEALSKAGLPELTGLTALDALPATGTRLHAVPSSDGQLLRVYGVTG